MRLIPSFLTFILFCSSSALAYKTSQLRSRCLKEIKQPCEVASLLDLGVANNRQLLLATYKIPRDKIELAKELSDEIQEKELIRGYAVFDKIKGDNGLELVSLKQRDYLDGGYVMPPEIAKTPFGEIIFIQSGSGNAVHEFSYFHFDQTWKELESESWKMAVKVPAGLRAPFFGFDLKTFKYNSCAQTSDDCHACCSGGTVSGNLVVSGNRLVLQNYHYTPPLLFGDSATEELLLKRIREAKDLSYREPRNGESLVIFAADQNYSKALKEALERGLDVNAVNNKGRNALFTLFNANVCAYDHAAVLDILFEAKINLDHKDKLGNTALMEAANLCQFEISERLLAAGATLSAVNSRGSTALHFAVGCQDVCGKDAARIKTVKLLLRYKADPTAKNSQNETPLLLAKRFKAEDVLPLLEVGK